MDAGPDQEPIETTNHLCDAGVHVGFCYRMYSVQGGLGHNVCERVLYSLQLFGVIVVYTIEKGVAVVNTASDYCVGQRCGGDPVKKFATLNDTVDVGDKVEIWVKNYTQIDGGWCGRDLVTKDIYGY